MVRKLIFLVFLIHVALSSFTQEWSSQVFKNPMDGTQYFQLTNNASIYESNCIGKIIITHEMNKKDGDVLLADRVILLINNARFSFDNNIIYKFDSDSPVQEVWINEGDPSFVFLANAKYFLTKLVKSKRLVIQTNIYNRTYFLVFNISNIEEHIKPIEEIKWMDNEYNPHLKYQRDLINMLSQLGFDAKIYPFGSFVFRIVISPLELITTYDLNNLKSTINDKIKEINSKYENKPEVFKFYTDAIFTNNSLFNINFTGIKYYD